MGRHSTRYPAEVRDRAVRLVFEHGGEYGWQWDAMCSIAAKFGCTAETLRIAAASRFATVPATQGIE